jgi:ribosome-interacting GTPase 1
MSLLCALPCAAVKSVLSEYRIHNADVHLKQDYEVDDLIDVIEGSRVYIPW